VNKTVETVKSASEAEKLRIVVFEIYHAPLLAKHLTLTLFHNFHSFPDAVIIVF
jgi:hypothetical protein